MGLDLASQHPTAPPDTGGGGRSGDPSFPHKGAVLAHCAVNATYQPGFVGAGGALVAAWPMASLGRRPALLLTSGLFVAAAALKASFLSPLIAPDLCGGPASIGFGVGWLAMGLSSSVVPLYVGEVAPVARRGSLVGLYQLAFSFGLLLAQVPSEAAGDMDIDNEVTMRVAHALLALPALLLLLLGGRYLHDSPRSLLLLGRPDDARAALKHLYAASTTATASSRRSSSTCSPPSPPPPTSRSPPRVASAGGVGALGRLAGSCRVLRAARCCDSGGRSSSACSSWQSRSSRRGSSSSRSTSRPLTATRSANTGNR